MKTNKIHKFLLVVCVFILVSSCSKEDETFTEIIPKSIKIVNTDGSVINDSDCVEDDLIYGIKITVNYEGQGTLNNTPVKYTLNGTIKSVTIGFDNSVVVSDQFIAGKNVVSIEGAYINDEHTFTPPELPAEFTEVE